MELRPILSALWRHKITTGLIVLEIALSCAIICNLLFLIDARMQRMQRPSGVVENEVLLVKVGGTSASQDNDAAATTQADLVALRTIPGVKAAATASQATFGSAYMSRGVYLDKDAARTILYASSYAGSDELFDVLGLSLAAGRKFNPDEFIELNALETPDSTQGVPAVIITRHMAGTLFPGRSAVGQSIYAWGDQPIRIVGVVERLVRANDAGDAHYEDSMLFPVRIPYIKGGRFLIRVDDPARRAEVLKAAIKILHDGNSRRVVSERDSAPIEQMRDRYYLKDRAMAWLLVAACLGLVVITALGIVGLSSFWVQQRTKQIGVRRALGATRGQILRYFQTENFLLVTVGIALGMLLAYAINQWLMAKYALPRLPLSYLPIGAVTLWLLGQIAVFGPARRAAAVPPAVATRSV
ncbi:MAG: ABC transporter permease [Luteimonas sp.]